MRHVYKPRGVCSHKMIVQLDGETVRSITVEGGCDGNLQGLTNLLRGASAKEAIARLEGISCGKKSTSCPDQIAKALLEALAQQHFAKEEAV